MHPTCFLTTTQKYLKDFGDASLDAPNPKLTLKYSGDASTEYCRRCISEMIWSLNRARNLPLPHFSYFSKTTLSNLFSSTSPKSSN